LSSSGLVTEPVSSTGDEMLEAVFGRDITANLAMWSERSADASQEEIRVL